MSRFNPRIGANDTASFSNVAALQQEGRNRAFDRQLASEQLRSQIVQNTNQNRLAANQQAIEIAALEQQNEESLRRLTARMNEIRSGITAAQTQDATTRRGQDIQASLGERELGLQEAELGLRADNTRFAEEELGIRREQLAADIENNRLNREAQQQLQQSLLSSQERRATQEITSREGIAETERESRFDLQDFAGQQALDELEVQGENQISAIERQAALDEEMIQLRHSLESGEMEPEQLQGIINTRALKESGDLDLQSVALTAQNTSGREQKAYQRIADEMVIEELDARIRSGLFNDAELTEDEITDIQENILFAASPEVRAIFDEMVETKERFDARRNRLLSGNIPRPPREWAKLRVDQRLAMATLREQLRLFLLPENNPSLTGN